MATATAKKTTAKRSTKKTTAKRTTAKRTPKKELTDVEKRKLALDALEEQSARDWGEWTDENEDHKSLTPSALGITQSTISSHQAFEKYRLKQLIAKENAKPVKKRNKVVSVPVLNGFPTTIAKPVGKDWTIVVKSEPLITPEEAKKA